MRPRRYLLMILMVAVAAGAGVWPGCGGARVYQPDTSMVQTLGHEDAVARLRTILGRAAAPPVLDVDVTPEHLAILWMDTRQTSRLHFSHIQSVDIGSRDHVVTIRVTSTTHIYRFDFTNQADATGFVDLLASFYRETQPAGELPAVTRNRERL